MLSLSTFHISVSKNGKLLSKIFHQQRNNAENGQEPHMEDMTEVEIPELDIHQKVINNDGLETQVQAKRNVIN
jgi:sortase (surface protein transpeptidase)